MAPAGRGRGRAPLLAGGALFAAMGAAHFVPPVIYPWERHVEDLYPPVRWALFAITMFFGVLLVLGGVVPIVVARMPTVPPLLYVTVVGGMAGFWVLGTVYELAVPFPDPAARWALPAFSAAVALLYLGGLWLRSRPLAVAAQGDR